MRTTEGGSVERVRQLVRLDHRTRILLTVWTTILGHQHAALALNPGAVTIPVEITSAAEDRTAKRLAVLVTREFQGDPRFVIVSGKPADSVTVTLAARVGWERRLDWTEIRYQVRLSKGGGDSAVIAVACWNWDLNSCARQITNAAAHYEAG